MKDLFIEVYEDVGPYPEEPWANVMEVYTPEEEHYE